MKSSKMCFSCFFFVIFIRGLANLAPQKQGVEREIWGEPRTWRKSRVLSRGTKRVEWSCTNENLFVKKQAPFSCFRKTTQEFIFIRGFEKPYGY